MALEDLHADLPLDAKPLQRPDCDVQKIPCCWIVTPGGEDRRVKLNDSSMLIWRLCEGENTVGDIIGALQEQYPDVEGMDKDIQRALDELLQETLISVS